MKRKSPTDPAMLKILASKNPELDYGYVMDCLKEYKAPRGKLNHLLKTGALVRIKQGLYIPGEDFIKTEFSLPVIANKIFGPSYVSFEWALSYHNLIPEKVTTVTSASFKRKKSYETPLGLFTFDHIPKKAYPTGVLLVEVQKNKFAQIASKEKALADYLRVRRGRFSSICSMQETLFEDMRIDEEDLEGFDLSIIEELINKSLHSSLIYLKKLLKKIGAK